MESIYQTLQLTEDQFWFGFLPLVGSMGFFLVAMAAFAIRTAVTGLPRSSRVVNQGGTPLLGAFVMEYFYWLIGPVTRFMVRHQVSPNVLTAWSLVFGLASAVALAVGYFGLGGWLIMLSATMDVFDGMVARARGLSSDSGDFWDSVADRICDAAAFIGLAIYWRDNVALVIVAMVAMVASFTVSYARAKAESYGVKCYGGVMQRHERIVYLGIGTAAAPLVALISEPGDNYPEYWLTIAAVILVAVFSSYTAVRRMTSTFANLRARETQSTQNSAPAAK
jgi:phosphatidylglycerophosphate synthase